MFHAHTLKGTDPTLKETKLFLLRAKYELDRIPEIRQNLIRDWQDEGDFKKKDAIFAHMIAERQASIEGRLWFEAKKAGKEPHWRIPTTAEEELKAYRTQTPALAKKFQQTHALSKEASINCISNILRHKETHGEKPSGEQINAIIQIERELEKDAYKQLLSEAGKQYKPHELHFLHRKMGDILFTRWNVFKKLSLNSDLTPIQEQAKESLKTITPQMTQELLKVRQKEFSL